MGGECQECGDKDLSQLEFHHINPEEKSFNLAGHSMNNPDVIAELAKCKLLCAICHKKEHRQMKENKQ